MATFEEQSDLVVDQIETRSDQADDLLAETQAAIVSARTAIDVGIQALLVNGISITLLPLSPFTAATATAPTLPDADSIAIDDSTYDAVFLRAQGLQDRIAAKELSAASNRAAWRGHAEWDETEAANVTRASDIGKEETSKNALASAESQAQALREDVVALAPQHIANFAAQWETKTRSEQARLEYERLNLDRAVEPERIRAEYDLKKTELAQVNAVGQLLDMAQILAQVSSALVSGSDVNLSSRVGMSLGQVVYNPSEGEVVQSPS